MIPRYDFQPRGVNCLPGGERTNHCDSLESEPKGHVLAKGDLKVANLFSPVIQAAQVPVGSWFCS